VDLRTDQSQVELVIAFEESGRIDEIRAPDRIENIGYGDVGLEQLGGVRANLEFRLFPSLHQHRGDTVQSIEAWLDVIGRHLPQIRLQHGLRSKAIANNGKTRKRKAIRFDVHGGRQRTLDCRHRGIDPLKGLEHIHIPVKVQVDFGGAATGNGLNRLQPFHAVDGLLQRARDGHHHLVDRHNAVINTDDYTRKIRGGKHCHGDGERHVAAYERQREDEKDNRF